MKGLRIVGGSKARLEVAELPTPRLLPHHALVRVAAAGLNRADVLQLHGNYPVPTDAPQDVPGLEFAGRIEALGDGCSRFTPGQRVFGISSGGAHAQYVANPEDLLTVTPEDLSDTQAAAIPEAFITAHDALITQARMEKGECVLVHAAGSGVGLAALQVAALYGCEFFGTTRHETKLEALRRLPVVVRLADAGAAMHFISPDAFDETVLAATGRKGANIILDPVGAAYFERNLNALTSKGRVVIIATMGGQTVTLSLSNVMRKRLQLIGTVLRSRTLEEKIEATRAFERDLLPALITSELEAVIDSTFELADAAAAYARMEANENVGKIVLTMPA